MADNGGLPTQPAFAMQGDKGWSDAALISGAQHIGLSPAAIGLLPRGPAELVEARCSQPTWALAFPSDSVKRVA